MGERIKNYVGIALIIALLGLLYGILVYMHIYSQVVQPSRTFLVSGEGRVVAVPDIAQISLGVSTEGGTDIAVLQQENTEGMNGIIEFLKEKGIAAQDIHTQHYSIDPRYDKDQIKVKGYAVRQTVSVKIRDFAKISDILGEVISRGANTVSQLSFTIDDPTELQRQAKEKAIKKAREEAIFLAETGGFSIGRLVSVQEGFFGPYPFSKSITTHGDLPFGAGEPGPIIEPGSQEIVSTINLVYEIR